MNRGMIMFSAEMMAELFHSRDSQAGRSKRTLLGAARLIAPRFSNRQPSWRLTWEFMQDYILHYKWNLEREMFQADRQVARELAAIPVTSVLETFLKGVGQSLLELPGYETGLGFDLDAFIDVTRRADIRTIIEVFPRDPNRPVDCFASHIMLVKPLYVTEAFQQEHGDEAAIEMVYPLIVLDGIRRGTSQEELQDRFNHHRGIWNVESPDAIGHFVSLISLCPSSGNLLEPHIINDERGEKKGGKLRFTSIHSG